MINKDKAKKLLDKLISKEEEEVDELQSIPEIEAEEEAPETQEETSEDDNETGEEGEEAQVVEADEDEETTDEDDFELDDLNLDEFDIEDDEEDDLSDDDAAELESDKQIYKDALSDLINAFNAKNEKTPYNMFVYAPTEDHYKSFKVGFEIDDTMIYFDNGEYDEGKVDLKFNDVFYGELDALAKEAGIRRIEWSDDDDGVYGTITV